MITATSLMLDTDLTGRVRHLASQRRRSPRGIMREAIEQYVTHEEMREKLRQDGLAALADYKKTGLHLTGQEVYDWLDTWGTGEEKAAPECHG